VTRSFSVSFSAIRSLNRIGLHRLFIVALAVLSTGVLALESAVILPVASCQIAIDGNPREAILHGAGVVPMFDAATGLRDGSLRAYALAAPQGLYVALLSTEAPDAQLALPAEDAAGSDLLMGEWMAVRVGGAAGGSSAERLFALLPGQRTVCLNTDGTLSNTGDSAWLAAGKIFGFTWAGEWLLSWETLGLKPGDNFRMEVLRGRKKIVNGVNLEVLARATPRAGASRWDGEGIVMAVPLSFPEASKGLFGLKAFDVRPFIPEDEKNASCESAVPAGEVATAWLEWRGEGKDLRLVVGAAHGKPGGPMTPPAVSRLDFWWQSGRRAEQDAYFPARVAAGEGDIFVAERLFPQKDQQATCSAGDMIRFVVTWRVPKSAGPGLMALPIQMMSGSQVVGRAQWRINVTPPLADEPFLAGIYYLTKDPSRWDADLADIADHGFTAVTCPAEGQEEWLGFKALARKHGLDGRFALSPDRLTPQPGDWAYVCDEPGTADALRRAEARGETLASKGWKTWGALCWKPLGRLPEFLDACAFAPNLLAEGTQRPRPQGAFWTYIQGLREDPAYNRAQIGREAFEHGLSGVWVFCYRPEPEGKADDWKNLPMRYDACVVPGASGSLSTIEWEALRQGILEGRLLRSGRAY
jgi:hypothetical protein